MRTKLVILLLFLAASAHGQLVTNILVRTTVDIINTGISTNSSNNTLTLTYSNAKERLMIEGAIYDFKKAQAAGQTNVLEWYLSRITIKDRFKAMADEKNRAESSVTLEKLSRLLTTDIDLLSVGDLSSLATISAKAP